MMQKPTSYSWRPSTPFPLHVWSMTSSWHCTEASHLNSKQSMISKICRDFRSRRGKGCFVIFCGQTPSRMKKVNVLNALLEMMSEVAPFSLDSRQQINFCIRINYCLYLEHMRHNLMGIKCINGMEHRNFLSSSRYFQLLIIATFIITKVPSSNLKAIH